MILKDKKTRIKKELTSASSQPGNLTRKEQLDAAASSEGIKGRMEYPAGTASYKQTPVKGGHSARLCPEQTSRDRSSNGGGRDAAHLAAGPAARSRAPSPGPSLTLPVWGRPRACQRHAVRRGERGAASRRIDAGTGALAPSGSQSPGCLLAARWTRTESQSRHRKSRRRTGRSPAAR